MPEASRTGSPKRDVKYPSADPEGRDVSSKTAPLDLPGLPESASPASNPALNRSAEALGRGMGTAVAGVRRLPRQLDKLRSRIHVVPRHDMSEIRESALEAAADWRDAAEDSIAEWKNRAELYAQDVAGHTNRRLEVLQRRMAANIATIRRKARRWEWDQPLKVIATCAAAGFVAGVALRIWRSNNNA